MYRYKDFFNLNEDYPQGFSLEELKKVSSFAGKYRYVNSRLPKLASGSGRTVFKVDDTKVIKLAKNKKGIAQNSIEAEAYIQTSGVTAKVFDSDEYDFWVEMELAKKVGRKRFEQLSGVKIDELGSYLRYRANQMRPTNSFNRPPATSEELNRKMENNEFVAGIESLIVDYDMEVVDLARLSTYGEVEREGSPSVVLVDFGLTKSIYNDFYRAH